MGKRRLQGEFIADFQYLTGNYKKDGEGLLARACRIKKKGLPIMILNCNILGRYVSYESDEAPEQIAQRNCGCPTPGIVQAQAGWGFEKPDLMEVVPGNDREFVVQ